MLFFLVLHHLQETTPSTTAQAPHFLRWVSSALRNKSALMCCVSLETQRKKCESKILAQQQQQRRQQHQIFLHLNAYLIRRSRYLLVQLVCTFQLSVQHKTQVICMLVTLWLLVLLLVLWVCCFSCWCSCWWYYITYNKQHHPQLHKHQHQQPTYR